MNESKSAWKVNNLVSLHCKIKTKIDNFYFILIFVFHILILIIITSTSSTYNSFFVHDWILAHINNVLYIFGQIPHTVGGIEAYAKSHIK